MDNKKVKYVTNQIDKFPSIKINRNFNEYELNNKMTDNYNRSDLNFSNYMFNNPTKLEGNGCLNLNNDLRHGTYISRKENNVSKEISDYRFNFLPNNINLAYGKNNTVNTFLNGDLLRNGYDTRNMDKYRK